jgi:rare lipoprotein A
MSAQVTQRVIALAAIAALSACDDAQGPRSTDAPVPDVEVTAGANPATAPNLAEDIEAPEVFQVADEGLWDGRPSLGGVWVAHSDVTDPERVIIRNEDNGRSVTAALFRRERENPGPRFQVSSDAAEELGMLAGSPANLSVTALRREDPAPPEVDEETAVASVEDTAGASPAEADTAADDAAMAGTPEAAAAEAARVASVEVAPEAPPKKRGLFGFLRKKPQEADTAGAMAAPADAAVDGSEIAAATTAAIDQIQVETLSSDGAAPVAVAPEAAPPAAADAPAAAELPVIVETPKRKRRLFGFGRRDDAPLSAFSDDSASAAPLIDVPTETLAAGDVAAEPAEIAVASADLVAAPALDTTRPKRRGLFGLGRAEEAPLSAFAGETVGSEPAVVEVADAPAEADGSNGILVAEAPAVEGSTPRRRGLFGRSQQEPLSALQPIEVAAVLPAEPGAMIEPAVARAEPEGGAKEAAPEAIELAALDDTDFVQAGRFRSFDEAEEAAAGLRSGGVIPSLRRGGDGAWLVLVGPFPEASERPAILDKVKSLGFSDAYLVPG